MATVGLSPLQISSALLQGADEEDVDQPDIPAILPRRRPNPLLQYGPSPEVLAERERLAALPPPVPRQTFPQLMSETVGTVAGAVPGALERMGQGVLETEQLRQQGETGAAEAALSTATGLVGATSGMVTFATRAAADLGKAKGPDYFKRLYELSHEIARQTTYQPRTEVGQALAAGISAPLEPLLEFSRIASEAPLARMTLTEDQRYALRFAHELLTFAALDVGLRGSLGSVRSKVSKYRNEFGKIAGDTPESAPAAIAAAEDLTRTVEATPEISAELQAARQRLVDTLAQAAQQPVSALQDVLQRRGEQQGRVNPLLTPEPEQVPTAVTEVAPRSEPPSAPAESTVVQGAPSGESATSLRAVEKVSAEGGEAVVVQEPVVTPGVKQPRTRTRKKVITEEPAPIPIVEEPTPAVPAPPSPSTRVRTRPKAEAPDRLDQLEQYFTPGEIVPSYYGQDRVIEFNRLPENRFNVVVQAVDEAGSALAEAPRIHSTEPSPRVLRQQLARRPARNEPAAVPETPGATEAPAPATQRDPVYYRPPNVSDVGIVARGDVAEPLPTNVTPGGAVQLRYRNYEEIAPNVIQPSGKPEAILVDITGLNTTTSLATIRDQVIKGKMSPEMATALEANLQRQADLAGVPLEQAHRFTGEDLLNQMTRIAAEQQIDLYRAKRTRQGIEYEQVDPETIRTFIEVEGLGDVYNSKGVGAEPAGKYLAEKTKPVGEVTLEEIQRSLEQGVDIKDQLPLDIREQYSDMFERAREGIDTNEVRTFISILRDIRTLIDPGDRPPASGRFLGGERGSLSAHGLTPNQRAAAERLWADAIKEGMSIKRMLDSTQLPEAEKALFARYLAGRQNPPPVGAIEPYEMRLNPEGVDQPVYQRVNRRTKTEYAPLYQSEIDAIQQARELGPRQGLDVVANRPLGRYNLNVPYFALRRADLLEPLAYAYRASERARSREMTELNRDLNALARSVNRSSRERVMEHGYAQSPQGRRILEKNNRIPPTLTASEQAVYDAGRTLFDDIFTRSNDVRDAIGKPRLERVEDYVPFLRTFTIAQQNEMGLNLITDSAAKIARFHRDHINTPFPYEKKRTGAAYTAEFDFAKVMQTYMDSALRQIHLAPFIAKLEELISHPIPDPITGKPTWRLSEHKPRLHEFLQEWKQFLVTGVQSTLPKRLQNVAYAVMNNIAFSTLGLNIRSALSQTGALVLSLHDIGPKYLSKGIADSLSSAVRLTDHREFAFKNSQVLDTRMYQDVYNDVSAAIIGRSPRDFYQALRDGQFREVQQTVSAPTFKLLQLMDMESAVVTWNGAYRLATEKLGKSGRDAFNFADDAVVRTQGGSMPGDVAAIQRTLGGRVATQFQRFLISNWNFLLEDVFGVKNTAREMAKIGRDPNKYLPSYVKNILKFTAAITAYNVLSEDILGTPSPFPTPIRDARKGIEQNESILQIAGRLAGSMIEPIPIIGSSRYGKGFGGPVLETARDVTQMLRGDPLAYKLVNTGNSRRPPDDLETAVRRIYGSPPARLLGAPGAGQVGKYLRGRERGESVSQSLTGFYDPQSRGNRASPGLRKPGEGLRRVR